MPIDTMGQRIGWGCGGVSAPFSLFRVRTHQGTFLAVDRSTGHIVHTGDIEPPTDLAPLRLYRPSPLSGIGHVVLESEADLADLPPFATTRLCLLPVRIEPCSSGGRYALRNREGLYLCAPHGAKDAVVSADFARVEARAWEEFELIVETGPVTVAPAPALLDAIHSLFVTVPDVDALLRLATRDTGAWSDPATLLAFETLRFDAFESFLRRLTEFETSGRTETGSQARLFLDLVLRRAGWRDRLPSDGSRDAAWSAALLDLDRWTADRPPLAGNAAPAAPFQLGPDLDWLGEDRGGLRAAVPQSPIQAAVLLHRRHVTPRRNLCLVATARNEGPYLVEWIAYHRAIGVDAIFLYSNTNDDGSDALLAELHRQGLVTWVDSQVGADAYPQYKAYGHAFGMVPEVLDFRWALVIDLDEFVVFDTDRFASLAAFADWQDSLGADTVALAWLMFGSGGAMTMADGPVTHRFTLRQSWADPHVKSLTRPNRTLHSHCHAPLFDPRSPITARDASGRLHWDRMTGGNPAFNSRAQIGPVAVNHYQFKSLDEFLWKRWRNTGDHRIGRTTIDPESVRAFMAMHAGLAGQVEDRRAMACCPDLVERCADIRARGAVAALEAAVSVRMGEKLCDIRQAVLADAALREAASEDGAIGGFLEALRRSV